MQKWECPCGYIYDPSKGDPDNGIAPGTSFDDLPDDWVCPPCGAPNEDDASTNNFEMHGADFAAEHAP